MKLIRTVGNWIQLIINKRLLYLYDIGKLYIYKCFFFILILEALRCVELGKTFEIWVVQIVYV